MGKPIVILGIFVADNTYRALRLPKMGETVLGSGFTLGPGGKGSNQAVAVGKLGGDVSLLTRLGVDAFADMARLTWDIASVKSVVIETPESYTGSAFIFIEEASGNNAIIVTPGAAALISQADINAHRSLIESSCVFMTQLEHPSAAALAALQVARDASVTTILNPAPATPVPGEIFALCDYITPNETEAEALTGVLVNTIDNARRAGDVLLSKGAGTALITLGDQGALLHNKSMSLHLPAIDAGPVVETTGAGDAFNGGFAFGLADGMDPINAARFAITVAGISVTRKGAAISMPTLAEVQMFFQSVG